MSKDGKVLGRGRNKRVQEGNNILHVSNLTLFFPSLVIGSQADEFCSYACKQGETSALQNAGRLSPEAYKGATMYTTLSPCDMCKCSLLSKACIDMKDYSLQLFVLGTGACLLFGIPRVVVGENKSWLGGEAYLKSRGVEVLVMDDPQCLELMQKFMAEKPDVW